MESYYWVWRGLDAIRTPQWKLHRFADRCELHDILKDQTESNNLAAASPEVVKSLTARMDAWVDSLGAAPGHQPAPKKWHHPPAPEGEVLAITVTITEEAKPRDHLALSVANWGGTQYATDWIEYDIAFSSHAPKRNPFCAPLEGKNKKPFGPIFKPGTTVDQFGRDVTTGPRIADGKSVWEHRIVGLSNSAPGPLGKHGVVFTGGTAGTFTVYFDNLRLRHANGSTTSLWTSGKDTRAGAFTVNNLFKDLQVRTVNAEEVRR